MLHVGWFKPDRTNRIKHGVPTESASSCSVPSSTPWLHVSSQLLARRAICTSSRCAHASSKTWMRKGRRFFVGSLSTRSAIGIVLRRPRAAHVSGLVSRERRLRAHPRAVVVAMNYVAQAFVALDGEIVIEIVDIAKTFEESDASAARRAEFSHDEARWSSSRSARTSWACDRMVAVDDFKFEVVRFVHPAAGSVRSRSMRSKTEAPSSKELPRDHRGTPSSPTRCDNVWPMGWGVLSLRRAYSHALCRQQKSALCASLVSSLCVLCHICVSQHVFLI